jgi:hypothetical protein
MVVTSLAKECSGGRLPLCARYASMHAGLLGARVDAESGRSDHRLLWALGLTSGGEVEVLGVWPAQIAGVSAAEQIASDLLERGMERVRVLVNGAGDDLWAEVRRKYPGATCACTFEQVESLVLPLVGTRDRAGVVDGLRAVRLAPSFDTACALLRALELGQWSELNDAVSLCRVELSRSRALYSLPRRLRLATHRLEQLAQRLQDGALSALGRHGPFVSPVAAAAFSEAWLARAERRLRSQPKASRVLVRSGGGAARTD